MCAWGDFVARLLGLSDDSDDVCASDDTVPSEEHDTVPDEREFDTVRLGELSDGRVFERRERDGRTELVVDPENGVEGSDSGAAEALLDAHQRIGGFDRPSTAAIVRAYREGGADEYSDELVEFYERKVPEQFVPIIRESAVLRVAEEEAGLSYEEVRRRRKEMTKYDDAALELSALCSSGYLDEGGLFRQQFERTVLQGTATVDDYRAEFDRVVRARPFVVYVKHGDSYENVYDNVITKSIGIGKYDWEFDEMHVRGRGERLHETVRRVAGYLESEHSGVDLHRERDGRDLLARLDPETL